MKHEISLQNEFSPEIRVRDRLLILSTLKNNEFGPNTVPPSNEVVLKTLGLIRKFESFGFSPIGLTPNDDGGINLCTSQSDSKIEFWIELLNSKKGSFEMMRDKEEIISLEDETWETIIGLLNYYLKACEISLPSPAHVIRSGIEQTHDTNTKIGDFPEIPVITI